jgi:phenylpropionate dioxygenase-like ring-hydroxylating dioxygenase large terminal subunit
MATKYAKNYEKFYSEEYPELGNDPISTAGYLRDSSYEKEIDKIFKKSWFYLCSESELKDPGSYVVKDIPHLHRSIIVIRGNDGAVRAFDNVCKHRGNKLIYEECSGSGKKVLTCPFHAWTYNLDGSVRGIPERDRFIAIDTAELSLSCANISLWNGLVFFNPDMFAEQTVEEYLGELGEFLEKYDFKTKVLAAEWSAELDANWKVVVDAFQEGYHVSVIHQRTAQSLFTGPTRPSCRLSDFRIYGNHRAVTTPINPEFVPSKTEALSFQMAGAALSQEVTAQDFESMGLNPGGEKDFGFDINVIFPTTFLDTSVGWYFSYEFWPVSKNKTKWVAKLYMNEPTSWTERIGQEFTVVQLREALFEDLTTIEQTQKGLESGVLEKITLSDQELAIRHQHYVIDNIINKE